MPIIDVEVVYAAQGRPLEIPASVIASALGAVFGSSPGRTWVRIRLLASSFYAENESELSPEQLPVFVTVLHAHPPAGELLAREILEVTRSVAACLARPAERVHVQYAPPAAGRQAFGGNIIS